MSKELIDPIIHCKVTIMDANKMTIVYEGYGTISMDEKKLYSVITRDRRVVRNKSGDVVTQPFELKSYYVIAENKLKAETLLLLPVKYDFAPLGRPQFQCTFYIYSFIKLKTKNEAIQFVKSGVNGITFLLSANSEPDLCKLDTKKNGTCHFQQQNSASKELLNSSDIGNFRVDIYSGFTIKHENGALIKNIEIDLRSTNSTELRFLGNLTAAIELYIALFLSNFKIQLSNPKIIDSNNKYCPIFIPEDNLLSLKGRNLLKPKGEEINPELIGAIANFALNASNQRPLYGFKQYLWLLRKEYAEINYAMIEISIALDTVAGRIAKGQQDELDVDRIRNDINLVLDLIKNHKNEISNVVYRFYNKDADSILQAILRRPFRKTIEESAHRVDMTLDNKDVELINEISAVRSQVIHGQNYDGDHVRERLVSKTRAKRETAPSGAEQITYFYDAGLLERSLNFFRRLGQKYFEKMTEDVRTGSQSN